MVIKEKADGGASVREITRMVNGGSYGLKDRQKYYELAIKAGIKGV